MSIRKFRKSMKPFILVLTIVFLLSLVIGGYESFKTSRMNKKAQEAMLLNGKYIKKVEIEREKNQMSTSLSRGDSFQIPKDLIDIIAFNKVIDKYLSLDIAKKLKIKVSDAEVNEVYKEVENSIGDKEQFVRMLEYQGLTKNSYKENIREELLLKKIVENFINDYKPSDEEISEYYSYYPNGDLASAKEEIENYLKKVGGSKKYSQTIEELRKDMKLEEVSSEYQDLVEKELYKEKDFSITNLEFAKLTLNTILSNMLTKEKAEESVKELIKSEVKVAEIAKEKGVEVNEKLSSLSQFEEYKLGLLEKVKQEIKVDDTELLNYFNKNVTRYDIKDSADVNMAFINIKPSEEDEKIAKEKAEEILKRVTKDNFEEEGQKIAEAEDCIYENLGTFSKGKMVKEFENAVRETPSGTILNKVVKTGFGYHIIYVKENNSKEEKWTASHILVRALPSEKTMNLKMEKLNKIKDDLEKGLVKFADITKLDENIVQTLEIKGVTPDGNIPNFGNSKEMTDRIFKLPINGVEIVKFNPGIILFQKFAEVKAEKADFQKIKDRVKQDYLNYKAKEYIANIF